MMANSYDSERDREMQRQAERGRVRQKEAERGKERWREMILRG